MSETSESLQQLVELRRKTGRNKPPFLTRREIRKLAERLDSTQFVVESVLQVAGHVLRERYRRRGWMSVQRGRGHHNKANTARKDVKAAMEVLA